MYILKTFLQLTHNSPWLNLSTLNHPHAQSLSIPYPADDLLLIHKLSRNFGSYATYQIWRNSVVPFCPMPTQWA
jgi:hypothetical protein